MVGRWVDQLSMGYAGSPGIRARGTSPNELGEGRGPRQQLFCKSRMTPVSAQLTLARTSFLIQDPRCWIYDEVPLYCGD